MTPQECGENGVIEQTDNQRRKEHGDLKVEQGKPLNKLEREDSRLKRLVADLALEKPRMILFHSVRSLLTVSI